MYHVSYFARALPNKVALIFDRLGVSITFAELEAMANRAANAFVELGLVKGDCVALCIDNSPALIAATLGAQRIGLYYVLASTKLSLADLDFIVSDSNASLVLLSAKSEAARANTSCLTLDAKVLTVDWPDSLPHQWERHFDAAASDLPEQLAPGREMIYTSGTTGRPKGVRKPAFTGSFDQIDSRNQYVASGVGLTTDSVFLSTSPLYHSAPNRYLSAAIHYGATSVVMESFDALRSLELLAQHSCSHSIWVPTMFHRLLRLPQDVRGRHNLSSMKVAVHGAASCPVSVKEAMIDWWGPILYEYYSGTEGIGATAITSAEWLTHKGSVGKAKDGILHILNDSYEEAPPGTVGKVFFESNAQFEYWKDPVKTSGILSPQGWRSFGDVGYMDSDGYLYLTDRADFTINTGGVKVYPQEIENFLLSQEVVADAAVFGIPNEEYGEEVIAVVQLVEPPMATLELKEVLRASCRAALGAVKTPKAIYFDADLPRHATGKLYKKHLRERYLKASAPPSA